MIALHVSCQLACSLYLVIFFRYIIYKICALMYVRFLRDGFWILRWFCGDGSLGLLNPLFVLTCFDAS